VHNVNRQGLIEFKPKDDEEIKEYRFFGSVSRYLGPDRINGTVNYIRQNIDPEPENYKSRKRDLLGGSITYQIYRPLPLPGRDLNSGLGRRFETRGIDVNVGVLDDKEHFPDEFGDVLVRRQDLYAGVTA